MTLGGLGGTTICGESTAGVCAGGGLLEKVSVSLGGAPTTGSDGSGLAGTVGAGLEAVTGAGGEGGELAVPWEPDACDGGVESVFGGVRTVWVARVVLTGGLEAT
ncbi:MAG: hypothetical protein JSU96_16055 [Acidobacteriota bacterium]|nr:MAG: hypothetical protein JSU96_16055 [Acidobacteriota bacterium]